MIFSRIPLLLTFLHVASAEQPSAPSPISAPLRELPWSKGRGSINFLHTTDTHGWHGGHLKEAQYSADWGDYISFAHHLRQRADEDGSDLLLIDTGDRVDGNGLYDASDPKGKYTFDVFKEQKIDVITSGNHELYLANSSIREYDEVVPDFRDSYIASNLDIYSPKSGKLEPFAPRYRKFTTKNSGIRILAFGFLFNFHGNANNTVVQSVQETIKEKWFQDAIREKDVDLFLVAGHVPVRDSEESDLIYKAIRNAKWDTPIVFFGGHTHIRDYRKWEKKAWGLESGRYMETLGFLSINGLSSGKRRLDATTAKSPVYRRMYIDNNLFSLHHHSGTNHSSFPTEMGKNVSEKIEKARKKMNLDEAFGCAPQDYWLNRAPYPANDSFLSLLDTHILPDTFTAALQKPSIVISNSGAIRFDIFKGPFTIDSTFLVSPFTSGFRAIRNVPYGAASQVLQYLNNQGQILLEDLVALSVDPTMYKLDDLTPPLPPVGLHTLERVTVAGHKAFAPRLIGRSESEQILLVNGDKDAPALPGYTTRDDAGSDGDDTIHQEIQFYDVPNCIAANIHFSPSSNKPLVSEEHAELRSRQGGTVHLAEGTKPETVDLVYNVFVQDWVLLALQYLGHDYGKEATEEVLEGQTMTDIISGWVRDNWACEGEK
ncbi:hypothetical protein B0A50_01252 [Salinomyces thailandicus]|uniref:Uncharacterized protein n=1 Tax=Salinomyces thailandicus TaxID=706561 RepID=A0A4U0UBY8_9PEZI|nr:hypothetical protein B0A50_01252 [Salinomyces thailandica]